MDSTVPPVPPVPVPVEEEEDVELWVDPLPACGGFDELSRESGGIFCKFEVHDGVQLNMKKPLSMNMATTHGVVLGQTIGPGAEDGAEQYMFGATYNTQQMALIGKMGLDGALKAHVINVWAPGFISKVQARVADSESVVNLELDNSGKDYSLEIKSVNDQVAFAAYVQKLTPALALGAQLAYVRPRDHTIMSLASRYATADFVATAKASTESDVSLTYMHKLNDAFSMATELDWNATTRKSNVKVGYAYQFLHGSRVRAEISSKGTVAAVIQEPIVMGVTLTLCGVINHVKETYHFGVGFSIGE